MAIQVKDRLFTIEMANTMYQMQVDSYGVLCHLWYGAKTGCSMEYLMDYPDVGFSGNIYDAGNVRNYSLDNRPLEYSTIGNGDYRIPALSVIHANGTKALDLRFEAYEILPGKYQIPGLPAAYGDETEAETLRITLKDKFSDIKVILNYGVFEKLDVITRSTVIINGEKDAVTIDRAHSLCLDISRGEWEWIHFHGRHNMERIVERNEIFHGIQESSSRRGSSSQQQNPTVLLCEKGATEERGLCYGAALLYSGGFQTQVEKEQMRQVRLLMGMNPELFSWQLNPGEAFYTPEVILSCSLEGFGTLSHQFHTILREHVCRGVHKLAERPVLINNWEATYFDFDGEKILKIARQAAELGVDMMVLDDGWFGKRNDDCSGLGDWFVNENKLKCSLHKLAEDINGLGMKFGLWFEPEMVSEDSDLYRNHPDWAIQIPGRDPIRSRFQLVLDMSRADVREYLYESIRNILNSANIEYVKWDMNRSVCDWFSAMLPAGRQGELPHRYVLGLYELLERLTTEFPQVLFEGCSGGGGRFDAGMLYYCPQSWCSDDTDAYQRTQIQYGTSFFYPVSAVGSHVSAVPNHQTGRRTSLEARGVTAMAGSFGYELDLSKLSREEKEAVGEQIRRFKQYGPLIHNGAYYRLSNPLKDNLAAWSFVEKDQSRVLAQGLTFRVEPNMRRYVLKLRGLEPAAQYQLVKGTELEAGQIYTGAALMAGGILLPGADGDDKAFEFYFERV